MQQLKNLEKPSAFLKPGWDYEKSNIRSPEVYKRLEMYSFPKIMHAVGGAHTEDIGGVL